MIDVEMWAIKDTEKDKLIITKFGRSTWKRKMHPKGVNIVGYSGYKKDVDAGSLDMLKPIRIRVTELQDD
tara:strand:- start:241 stop:450 length:210 start_codon:yes stop_codon:yes gene_type:complete